MTFTIALSNGGGVLLTWRDTVKEAVERALELLGRGFEVRITAPDDFYYEPEFFAELLNKYEDEAAKPFHGIAAAKAES